MILLSGRVVAYPAERRELAQALLSWVIAARQEPALLSAHVYEDLEAAAAFSLTTQWKTAADLDKHLRSDAFALLTGALRVLAQPYRMVVLQPDDEHGAIQAITRPRDDEADA